MSTIYYKSQKGDIASKEAWEAFLGDFYEWIPHAQPEDYWQRAVRVLGLEEIEVTENDKIITPKLDYSYEPAFNSVF